MKDKLNKTLPIITLVTYSLMIAVNALANILPINSITTGEVSDKYANLFAPAPITFSIWGVIYLLLLFYVIYQLRSSKLEDKKLFIKINILFALSSIANTLWILMWHYEALAVSVILMLVILLSLILINLTLKQGLSKMDRLMIKLPFSVYFGWITVATIANITTYLVFIGWDGFGISVVFWTCLIIIIGALIGSITMIRLKNVPYGLVILWAYLGITIKHISEAGFNKDYMSIILVTVICMVGVTVAMGYTIRNQFKKNKISES